MPKYPINATIHQLKELTQVPDWVKVDPWVVDALRGTVKEAGWRGTLTQYFQEHPLKPAILKTVTRLENLPDYNLPTIMPIPYVIGFGTYGWKYKHEIITLAYDYGIRFIDTAESYGYGKVEEELGKVVKELPGLYIATKVARNHMTYGNVLRAAKRSYNKLGKVDLYQAHWPNSNIQETMTAMKLLRQNNQIRMIGVSNYSVDQYILATSCVHPITSIQVRYNLLDRGIERALLPWCKAHNITVIAYSPLGQDFRQLANNLVLNEVARKTGAKPAQIAIAWLIGKGVLPIPRTNNTEHIAELADAVNLNLTNDQIYILEEAFPITE